VTPPGHAVISLGVGAIVWAFTRNIYAVLAAPLVGVLVDLDHLVDYYQWIVKERREHVWLFLHGYELTIAAILGAYASGWDPIVLAGALAYLAHILTDQFTNHVQPGTYFLTYRAVHGFRRGRVSQWREDDLFGDVLRFPVAGWIALRINPRLKRFMPEK